MGPNRVAQAVSYQVVIEALDAGSEGLYTSFSYTPSPAAWVSITAPGSFGSPFFIHPFTPRSLWLFA